MINLHERFNHYLNTNRLIDLQNVNERLISYGWVDDGRDLTGYYLLTEKYELVYNMKDEFRHKVPRKSLASLRK